VPVRGVEHHGNAKTLVQSFECENQLAAIAQSAAMPEEVSHPTKRKHKATKPPMKKAAV